MLSCLFRACVGHAFSNPFLSERSCTNQRTQIILERWSLDARDVVGDLSDGEHVRANGLQNEFPPCVTVKLFAWNGRQRFALENPQHRLFGLDELTGKETDKLVRGSRGVCPLKALEILPALGISYHAGRIASLHEEQVHEEP